MSSKFAFVLDSIKLFTNSPDAILFKIGGSATKYKHSKTATTTATLKINFKNRFFICIAQLYN